MAFKQKNDWAREMVPIRQHDKTFKTPEEKFPQ